MNLRLQILLENSLLLLVNDVIEEQGQQDHRVQAHVVPRVHLTPVQGLLLENGEEHLLDRVEDECTC